MSRALIVIHGNGDRQRVMNLVAKVPIGTRVEMKAAKRSIPQNSKLWAMLTDVASQVEWQGQKRRPDQWKILFMDALGREEMVMSLDGQNVVNIGQSSSDLSKDEMSDLMELIAEFGARHGVKFGDEQAA